MWHRAKRLGAACLPNVCRGGARTGHSASKNTEPRRGAGAQRPTAPRHWCQDQVTVVWCARRVQRDQSVSPVTPHSVSLRRPSRETPLCLIGSPYPPLSRAFHPLYPPLSLYSSTSWIQIYTKRSSCAPGAACANAFAKKKATGHRRRPPPPPVRHRPHCPPSET